MALKIENVSPLPKVTRDRPTSARSEDAAPPKATPTKRPAARKAQKSTDPLASPPRTITNRVASDLWEQFGARATELGVPLRVLLTDAITRALEQTPEEHGAAARATRRRERLARVDADD